MTFITLILFILLTNAYLDDDQINVLNELYNECNGDYWYPCKWNMTIMNNKSKDNYIHNHCGLFFDSPNMSNYQHVSQMNFWTANHSVIHNISGIIPSSIANLTHLTDFSLFYNDFHGTIPYTFCNLTYLSYFGVQGNTLNGTIPQCLFDLNHLSRIELYNTNINNKLWSLQIHDANYSGSIPDCIGYNLTNLSDLVFDRINNNLLTGPIPSSLNRLNLNYLSLYLMSGIDTENA
eukprot:323818_1